MEKCYYTNQDQYVKNIAKKVVFESLLLSAYKFGLCMSVCLESTWVRHVDRGRGSNSVQRSWLKREKAYSLAFSWCYDGPSVGSRIWSFLRLGLVALLGPLLGHNPPLKLHRISYLWKFLLYYMIVAHKPNI